MTSYTLPRLFLTACCLAIFIANASNVSVFAQACPVAFNTTGSIAATDPTQSNRITRNGVPSDCNGKAFPGLNDTTAQNRHFDQYNFTNTNATPACIQATFTGTIAGLHVVAYLNSFNPANVQTNYVGDLGVIYTANTTASFSFSVPAGANFVIVVHETTANGPANSYTLAVGCTAPPPPTPTAGQVLISEFRLSGPGATNAGSTKDEFIELYNNTDGPLTIGNFRLRAYDPNFFGPADGADFTTTLPAGTTLPARGHFLIADTTAGAASDSYSLSSYAAPDFALTFGSTQAEDFFVDNEGIELISPAAAATQVVIDSVGFTGSGGRPGETVAYGEGTRLTRRTQTPPTVNYAYVRKLTTGTPQDTGDNASDFALVSIDGSSIGGVASTLGAPGPERSTSPVTRNATIPVNLLDSTIISSSPPNRVRDFTPVTNGTFGTLSIRRRVTNTTGSPVTRLRFRVINITTFPVPDGVTADVRALTSSSTTVNGINDAGTCTASSLAVPCSVTVQGTTLEQPPTQPNGGGLNSSLAVSTVTTAPVRALGKRGGFLVKGVVPAPPVEVSPVIAPIVSDKKAERIIGASPKDDTIMLNAPLANGSSVNVQFLLGVQTRGNFRFIINVEALP